MTKIELAERLAATESAFRSAQRGNDWVRYRAALVALQAAEAMVVEVLKDTTSEGTP